MQDEKEISRNRPEEKGRANDPNLRNEDDIRSSNVTSTSKSDDQEDKLSRTASDDYHPTSSGDEKADKSFDE